MVLSALVVGITPQFLDCAAQGRAMQLANGMTAPMKCYWTAVTMGVLAVLLAGIGILNFLNKRKESQRSLSIMGMLTGAFVILIPTVLIGVCANPMMLCNMVMRPLLILFGSLTAAASVYNLIAVQRLQETAA
jgi:hypothetical protein